MRISDWSSDVCSSDLLAVTEGTDGGGADLARFLDRLAEVAVALQEDPGARLSWSALLSDGGETAEDRRRFVVVKPVIDFGSLAPLAGVVDRKSTRLNSSH